MSKPKTLADVLPAPDELTARQLVAKLKLQDHINKVVDAAPPFSDEQRGRLSILLAPDPFARRDVTTGDDVLDVLKEGRR